MDLQIPCAVNATARKSARQPEPLSIRWLGLNWSDHLPWRIGDIVVEHGSIDDALPFVRSCYPKIFGTRTDDHRWLTDPMTAQKQRFYREADVFLFRAGGSLVGLQIGHPSDWSSYYVRTVALLPEYRGRGLVTEVSRRMTDALAAVGVERIEGDVPPANIANMLAQTRLGYMATGLINTDRWGSMVRLTRYLGEAPRDVFLSQFCSGTWPQCRDAPEPGAGRSTP